MTNGSVESGSADTPWRAAQVIVMSVVCLAVGLLVGYLLRGSAPTSVAPVQAASTDVPHGAAAPSGGMPGGAMGQPQQMPTLEQMKQMADKQVQPLLAKLKDDPNNAELLSAIGTFYRMAHQFKEAQGYYEKSLAINPKNVGARTDLSSCLYYTGDVDGALAELQKSLSYDPKHAGTLFNIGMIKWKAKGDTAGAIASWEKLLKLNPNYEKKDALKQLIAEVKQQQALGGSEPKS